MSRQKSGDIRPGDIVKATVDGRGRVVYVTTVIGDSRTVIDPVGEKMALVLARCDIENELTSAPTRWLFVLIDGSIGWAFETYWHKA